MVSLWPNLVSVVKGCPLPSPAWQEPHEVATNIGPRPLDVVKISSLKARSPLRKIACCSPLKPSSGPSSMLSSAVTAGNNLEQERLPAIASDISIIKDRCFLLIRPQVN